MDSGSYETYVAGPPKCGGFFTISKLASCDKSCSKNEVSRPDPFIPRSVKEYVSVKLLHIYGLKENVQV